MARSFWGWGDAGAEVGQAQRERLRMLMSTQFDVSGLEALAPPRLEDVVLPAVRIVPPAALADLVVTSPLERAGHTYGKAWRDVVRGLRGDFRNAPDAVALPRDEADVAALLDWCSSAGIAAIPYGGGSSVVGGVEARCRDDFPGVVSIDLRRLDGVREIDATSRMADIGAGSYGPALEAGLRPHGLTLRHYPQSFEFSTLGGWIATRAGGHFATLYTHIDDLVASLTVVTPSGTLATRRVPASGAGPAPERLWLGSEGALGIVTRAWMRLQSRPAFRASASLRFADFQAAAEAARGIVQAGLHPSNCRLLDAREALINGIGDGATSFLLVGFESADHPLDAWLSRAVDIARAAGGVHDADAAQRGAIPSAELVGGEEDGAADRWRKMFLRGPYLRDALARMGVIVETFETAITWDRFAAFHHNVRQAAERAVAEICGGGVVSSRVTHVYPDGAAPYFTVVAPGTPGSQLAQWDEIKAAVSEVLLAEGGTITHHHAVGRDHRPWYDRERPAPFAAALRASKRALDPRGILNPGVLIDP